MDESRDPSKGANTCEYFIGLSDWDAQVGDPNALLEALSRVSEQLGDAEQPPAEIIEAAAIYPIDEDRLKQFHERLKREGFIGSQIEAIEKAVNEILLEKPVNYVREREGQQIPILRIVADANHGAD